jgi:RNA-directed DNA polymerase
MRGNAERFLQEWRDRLQKFGLELHPDKTRLRFAAASRKQRGEGKPETFSFLGFTHICGQLGRCPGMRRSSAGPFWV